MLWDLTISIIYYDVSLKFDRLKDLDFFEMNTIKYNHGHVSKSYGEKLIFYKLDLHDRLENLTSVFNKNHIDVVCNLLHIRLG